jgi:hypothetical protein
MRDDDLCANSATLSPAQREFANRVLRAKLDEITELYHRHRARGNLYLGGSVGLRQPAVRVRDGVPIAIKSDLDLFYALPKLPPDRAEQNFLEAVAALSPEMEVSVHLLPAIRVEVPLDNASFDDLIPGIEEPLVQGFEFRPFDIPPPYRARTCAQLAARRLAAAAMPYYHGAHAYSNQPADRIESDAATLPKALLDLLRLPCYESLGHRYGSRAMLELADRGYFEGICSPSLVRKLLRQREQIEEEAPPLRHCPLPLFRSVTARMLDLPDSLNAVEACRHFSAHYMSEDTANDLLHRCLLSLTLYGFEPAVGLLEQVREAWEHELFPRQRLGEKTRRQLERLPTIPTPEPLMDALRNLMDLSLRVLLEDVQQKLAACQVRQNLSQDL